jgi:FkbM family methyltransferase
VRLINTLNTLRFVLNHPLNKDRKTKALLNYLRWQVESRVMRDSLVFEWMPGTRAIVRRGDAVMTLNLYCGLLDFDDMAYVLHLMTPQELFVDIGANVGAYTMLACSAKGARGYCFEPVPSTFQRLLDNIAINHLNSKVVALNIGLSDHDDELVFTSDEGGRNHVVSNGESREQTIRVPVRPLDSILSEESPSIIKIDVEGFETNVLNGAEKTLSKPSLHTVIMELNGLGSRYGFDEQNILKKMLDYGFMTYVYEPFSRKLIPLHGKNNTYENTLFIRNEGEIQNRIAQAPRVSVGATQF